jgi:hypothetical protein
LREILVRLRLLVISGPVFVKRAGIVRFATITQSIRQGFQAPYRAGERPDAAE